MTDGSHGPDLLSPLTSRSRDEIEAAYRQGLLSSPLPMVLAGPGGRIVAVNSRFEELLGYEEAELHGRLVQDLTHPDDRARSAQVAARMAAGEPWREDFEARFVRRDGRVVWTRRHVFHTLAEDAGGAYAVGLIEDISEERMAQRQAEALVEVGRMIASGASLAEVGERLTAAAEDRWGDAGCSLMVRSESGEHLSCVAHGRLPDGYAEALTHVPVGPDGGACGNAAWRGERVAVLDLATDDRAARFRPLLQGLGLVSAWQVPVVDPLGQVVGAFGLFHRGRQEPGEHDWRALEVLAGIAGVAVYVDGQRRLRAQRDEAHRRDPLTGLPNALALHERLAELPEDTPLSLAVVRVDNLPGLSASLGEHAAGAVLRQLSGRAQDLGEVLLAAHVGPLSLAVASRGAWTRREPELLRRLLGRPVQLGALNLKPELRVGVSVRLPGEDLTADTLLRQATLALPQHGAAVYDPRAAQRHLSSMALSAEVRRALDARELVVHYQRKHDLTTGAPDGCEALVRWQHPERGLLSPGDFLEAVQLAAAGPDLALYVLRQAQADLPRLRARGLAGRVAVNVTAEDVAHEQLRDYLCDRSRRLWRDVDLELTEHALVDEECQAALQALAGVGYRIALDDFGTGWSSLSALHTLPLSAVKIDRSFVQRLPHDLAAEALVKGVVSTCEHLGLRVVAEGLESPEQVAAVRRLGCGTGQGYLFHRPSPLEALQAEPADVPPLVEQTGT